MIYKKKLCCQRLPVKWLLDRFGVNDKGIYRSWKQHFIQTDNEEVRKRLASILGISVNKVKSCILHEIGGDVNTHADNMSTGVYLLPLKYSPTVSFYDEDREVHFESGYSYKFNDFIRHGIYNPNMSRVLIISVDT